MKKTVNYYGQGSHLRLVQEGEILAVIPLEATSFETVKEFLEAEGVTLEGPIAPADVKPIINSKNGSRWF